MGCGQCQFGWSVGSFFFKCRKRPLPFSTLLSSVTWIGYILATCGGSARWCFVAASSCMASLDSISGNLTDCLRKRSAAWPINFPRAWESCEAYSWQAPLSVSLSYTSNHKSARTFPRHTHMHVRTLSYTSNHLYTYPYACTHSFSLSA